MAANAASIDAPLEGNLDRTAYLMARTRGCWSVLNFAGADPTGATDSTAAFEAAEARAHAEGGFIYAPRGVYKTTGFSLRRGVSLIGDRATLNHNHNTHDVVTLLADGPALGAPRFISGISFESLVVSSGAAIFEAASAVATELVVADVTFNRAAQNFAGSFYTLNSAAASHAVLERCNLRARNGGQQLIYTNGGSDSLLEVVGGRLKMAPTYGAALLQSDNTPLSVHRTRFDMNGHGTDSGYCVDVSGPADKRLDHCVFYVTGPGAAIKASGRLVETASDYLTSSGRYEIATPLGFGSRLDLQLVLTATVPTATPINIATTYAVGLRVLNLKLTHDHGGAGPTIDALPTALFAGQRFTLTIANKSTGTWASGVAFNQGGGSSATAIAVDRGRTWEFIAVDADNDGDLEWVVAHDPSYVWITP